jgi:hypothetical protein
MKSRKLRFYCGFFMGDAINHFRLDGSGANGIYTNASRGIFNWQPFL